ncbi:hypothetical protein J1614_008473 [Plenodomus biglobosus]|nr:hypothetical protein J1614_008473 [Plenodomus biglobosus]
MAYDIISSVGFGAPFGFVASGTDVAGLIRGFHDGLPAFGLMARLWPLTHWIKSTWLGEKYLVAKPTDNSGIGTLMRYRDGLIAQRQQDIAAGKPVRMDFLQTFLEARTERDEPLPMDYIKAEILLVMLAGADTTGTAFQSILAYMLADPVSYEKLMTELEHVTRAGKLSDIPTYDEVQEHCPFYMACVKESMRLCPPAPTIFPRIVGPDGLALPGGRVLPPGTEVTCNPWLVQRDTALYGPDASEFRPERWMQSEQQTKLFNRYSAVFGYGPRVCLGRDIAMMELCKAPLQFFRVFRAKVVEGREGKFVVKGGIGFWRDMWITIEKREGL